MNAKVCKGCGVEKPLETGYYHRSSVGPSGKRCWYYPGNCRDCENKIAADNRRGRSRVKNRTPITELALRIAEEAGDRPLAVYRGRFGGVAWCEPDREMRGELIGTYDHGADWRCIRADLECAA